MRKHYLNRVIEGQDLTKAEALIAVSKKLAC